MIRNPACAELWQPVGFVRQQMLANSYSFLPVLCEDGRWRLVSDTAVAQFLGPERCGVERKKRLSTSLKAAISESLRLTETASVDGETALKEAFEILKDGPVFLVENRPQVGQADPHNPTRLLGIVTVFDLL